MYSSSNVTVNGTTYYHYSSGNQIKFYYNGSTDTWTQGNAPKKPKTNSEAKRFLDTERGW